MGVPTGRTPIGDSAIPPCPAQPRIRTRARWSATTTVRAGARATGEHPSVGQERATRTRTHRLGTVRSQGVASAQFAPLSTDRSSQVRVAQLLFDTVHELELAIAQSVVPPNASAAMFEGWIPTAAGCVGAPPAAIAVRPLSVAMIHELGVISTDVVDNGRG